MQTYTQTFAANTTWKMNVPGKYFTTLQCSLAVNVRLYKGGKKLDLGDMSQLLAGLEVGPLANFDQPDAFDMVEVDVQAGDTVQIGIGNGLTRYNRANATVSVASSIPLALDSATKLALIRPEAYTGSLMTVGALSTVTAENIFTAAQNPNGVILLGAGCSDYAASLTGVTLLSKATAPANTTDGGIFMRSLSTSNTGAVMSESAQLAMEAYVPAGQGLWWLANSGTSAICSRWARWKAL